jgi:hypothetical protein
VLKVKPYVEGTCGWDSDFKVELLEPLENMVSLGLEVPLQGNLRAITVSVRCFFFFSQNKPSQ